MGNLVLLSTVILNCCIVDVSESSADLRLWTASPKVTAKPSSTCDFKATLYNFAAKLFINLNGTSLGVMQSKKAIFQISDVLIGPFYFRSGVGQDHADQNSGAMLG